MTRLRTLSPLSLVALATCGSSGGCGTGSSVQPAGSAASPSRTSSQSPAGSGIASKPISYRCWDGTYEYNFFSVRELDKSYAIAMSGARIRFPGLIDDDRSQRVELRFELPRQACKMSEQAGGVDCRATGVQVETGPFSQEDAGNRASPAREMRDVEVRLRSTPGKHDTQAGFDLAVHFEAASGVADYSIWFDIYDDRSCEWTGSPEQRGASADR